MADLQDRLALKARLPRTWAAFFERHGTFTSAQVAAIPFLLDGGSVLISAATASGKTEAALAPLIELHCPPSARPSGLRILYLIPTKALAANLYERLEQPLEMLNLRLAIKTGDRSTLRVSRPPAILITTPESADALLASHARLFLDLRAIVIDELHLFDGTPRGDQLRAVLRRIRQIRDYAAAQGDAPHATIQHVALSATLTAPAQTAARYIGEAVVVEVPGRRQVEAELLPLFPVGADQLRELLSQFRARGWKKALVFCNSRAEIERYAAAIRPDSPFGDAVFVHYSNIDSKRRAEIEHRFAEAEAALCFASSTLELGIDIGNIDVTILVGPPGSIASFRQRLGRAGRRTGRTHTVGFYRTDLERLLLETLVAVDSHILDFQGANPPFRPAVAIQQIFSLIRQSPYASVRPAELAALFEGFLARRDIEQILGELEQRHYLQPGRPGEWRAGERLNDLIDRQGGPRPGPSIHSNIHQNTPLLTLRDQNTGQSVAQIDPIWLSREELTFEGQPISIEWSDGEVVLFQSRPGNTAVSPALLYRSERQLLSLELAQHVRAHLGLAGGEAPLVSFGTPEDGSLWFHWLGDIYGRTLIELFQYRIAATPTEQPGLSLRIPDLMSEVPAWTAEHIQRHLEDHYRKYEPLLDLGPFQRLLPISLRKRAVVEQFQVERFLTIVGQLKIIRASEELAATLAELLADGTDDGR